MTINQLILNQTLFQIPALFDGTYYPFDHQTLKFVVAPSPGQGGIKLALFDGWGNGIMDNYMTDIVWRVISHNEVYEYNPALPV